MTEPTPPDRHSGRLAHDPRRYTRQNSRSISRRCLGAPGDFIGERPVNSVIHPAGLPINNLLIEVLRPPVESAQYTSMEFSNRLNDWKIQPSYGSVGDYFENAALESTWATIKRVIRHTHGASTHLTRPRLRTILFDYIETFYNRARHRAAAETYAASQAA